MIGKFTLSEKAIFSILQNHVSHQFYFINSRSCLIYIISANSHDITLKLSVFSLKIMIVGKLPFTTVKSEITFTLNTISIYSVFGMSLFKNVKIRPGFDDVHNFQTFGKTFSLLFQVLIQLISTINQ